MNPIRTQIVKIGNSRGIRIPKLLLDQVGLSSEVEISVQRDQLVIRPTSRPRDGWEEQFRAMAEHGDDKLLDEPVATRWDAGEWKW
ncbi:MAG TPA: AbrB/MazE/SpoVT family DNA-binding domain-containing protein [Anaerolineae bacterium]|nr:AbrB/MazE/SpoVT family DNA-binding domain-containing protein [Anaerolineae bacterium]